MKKTGQRGFDVIRGGIFGVVLTTFVIVAQNDLVSVKKLNVILLEQKKVGDQIFMKQSANKCR